MFNGIQNDYREGDRKIEDLSSGNGPSVVRLGLLWNRNSFRVEEDLLDASKPTH